MSKTYIPVETRRIVMEDAGHLCGYCRCSELVTSTSLVFEHIIPEAAGGQTTRENLWRSCVHCNQFKGDRIMANDPLTGADVYLFNPRIQKWQDHFAWSQDGRYILGLTPIGRATVETLHLNRELAVVARQLWVGYGWHPPHE